MSEKDQVSQEQNETETSTAETETVDNPFGLPADHPALKELAKVRREAASNRVAKNEVSEKAKKWEEYVESQKSEQEKLQTRLTQLEEDNKSLRSEKLRREIAKEYELDSDLEELLDGDEDQMRKTAEKLSTKMKALQEKETKERKPTDLHAGNRGKPVTKAPGSDGAAFLLGLSREMNL